MRGSYIGAEEVVVAFLDAGKWQFFGSLRNLILHFVFIYGWLL